MFLNDFKTATYIQIWPKGHNMICRFYMILITQDKYKYVTPQNVSFNVFESKYTTPP